MSGFYFSKVPKFKIRRGGVVEDISPPPLVPSAASGPGPTVLQVPEKTTDNSYIPPAPEATLEVPSTSIPARPVLSPGCARQSGKRKAGAKRGDEAFRAPTSPPPGKYEYINIRPCQDELDPTVLGKFPPPVANAAASVHKYWTSAFGEAADNAELTELLKLAEMYTFRSHVLNCKLYKVLEMKVDELHSVIGRDDDVEALRTENKDLQGRLAFSEDARARATYDITRARTIQKACVDAQKTAES
ncbi:hypothetical protein Fot_07088 [Forsythia ovata]|uniref:Uncharacterized protein n=1 Tax=Forsythia ovata TaxID=205694 RepID=A0ABD1WUT0_9LAMI